MKNYYKNRQYPKRIKESGKYLITIMHSYDEHRRMSSSVCNVFGNSKEQCIDRTSVILRALNQWTLQGKSV